MDSGLNAYIAGQSWSADFPTENPYQSGLPGFGNVVVSKFSSSGSSLIYSTYLGGSVVDEVRGLALDSTGNAYLGGYTISHDFPTVNAYQTTLGGGFGDFDYFVSKLSSTGSNLLYSTYLGGSDPEQGGALALDSALCAYITGMTYSGDFPTVNPYQGVYPGSSAASVSKLSSSGSALLFSTFLGGSAGTDGSGIAVDSGGSAFIVGDTDSIDFPTVNAYQASFAAGTEIDAFITRFSSTGSALIYSTYLGGSAADFGRGLVLNESGAAYVLGLTDSDDFPTANPYQAERAGNDDVWVAKVSSSGSALVFSTYLGSSAADDGYGIAVDGHGRTYVTGETYASDFPLHNPYQSLIQGIEAFATRFDASGSALLYSTFLGGSGDDYGRAIAVDSLDAAYVAGFTSSTDFPLENAYQAAPGGSGDAFISKLSWSCHLTTPTPTPSITPTATPSTTPTPSVIPTSSITPPATATPTATPSATPSPSPSLTPASTATPTPYPTPEYLVLASGDYNGNGSSDIAVFRQDASLWSVRGLGTTYYGRSGDIPVSGDYNGDGYTDVSVFRPSLEKWYIKDYSSFLYGQAGDIPAPADYDGDGVVDAGVFREGPGSWYIRGLTHIYWGKTDDLPVPGDYDGDGTADFAVFRPASGCWYLRGISKVYFGQAGDLPVPGVYHWYAGAGKGAPSFRSEIAVWRPSTGMWAVRGYPNFYFGSGGDSPVLGDFNADALDDSAVFRPSSGLWAVRGITRAYYGIRGDMPVAR